MCNTTFLSCTFRAKLREISLMCNAAFLVHVSNQAEGETVSVQDNLIELHVSYQLGKDKWIMCNTTFLNCMFQANLGERNG